MGFADYFERGALAAAQVVQGFDEGLFRERLDATPVGVAFDDDSLTPEGDAILDLLIRLLARLYPRVALLGPPQKLDALRSLATAINPALEIVDSADVGVGVGTVRRPFATTFYAGAAGWDALIGSKRPERVGDSNNPFGAGVSACLAAANVFRSVFLDDWEREVDDRVRFSTFALDRAAHATRPPAGDWRLAGEAVLIGVGAIGNAAVWALGRALQSGVVHLVDHQEIELSNLQRYVLADRGDEGAVKVAVAARTTSRDLIFVPHPQTLVLFLAEHGYKWEYFLLALDSARDRRTAQAALPRWVANGWTQPGDLGVSVHPRFGGDGACVGCLYLPDARLPNEDELVAATLNVPQLQMDVRTLLYSGAPLELPFLEAVGAANGQPLEVLLPFEGRTIRDLYVDGFCGGAIIPLGEAGRPRQDVHVPLAHQSALAGVLLAASLVRSTVGGDPPVTTATRVDVLRTLGAELAAPVRRRADGRCLCDDADFRAAYAAKYGATDRRG